MISKQSSTFSSKPIKATQSIISKPVVTSQDPSEQIREALAQALENNWVDLDEDEASDFELDAVQDMMMEFDLEDKCEEVRRSARKAVDGHRHTFLHRYMENTEAVISEHERSKELLKMPQGMNLRKYPTQ